LRWTGWLTAVPVLWKMSVKFLFQRCSSVKWSHFNYKIIVANWLLNLFHGHNCFISLITARHKPVWYYYSPIHVNLRHFLLIWHLHIRTSFLNLTKFQFVLLKFFVLLKISDNNPRNQFLNVTLNSCAAKIQGRVWCRDSRQIRFEHLSSSIKNRLSWAVRENRVQPWALDFWFCSQTCIFAILFNEEFLIILWNSFFFTITDTFWNCHTVFETVVFDIIRL
jgi:hypothetical protein